MNENPMHTHDFFISHTQADRDWATWVAWQVGAAGYSTIVEEWQPGGNTIAKIDRAHRLTRRTVVILSDDYLNSDISSIAWRARFADDPSSINDSLLLMKVGSVKNIGILSGLESIDLAIDNETVAKDALINRVSKSVGPASGDALKSAPPFPGIIKPLLLSRPPFPPKNRITDRLRYKYIISVTSLSLCIMYLVADCSLRPVPNGIHTVGARFGVPNVNSCPFENSSRIQYCDGKSYCQGRCTIADTCGDDPVHGTVKSCHINYRCAISGPRPLEIVNEDSYYTLSCPDYSKIDILYAKISIFTQPIISWLKSFFR